MTDQDKKTLENLELERLYRKYPNKFKLAVAISKRARQIKEGAKPLVNIDEDPIIPVVAALHELDDSKYEINMKEDQEVVEILDQFDKELEEEIGEELEEDVKSATAKKSKAKKVEKDKRKSKSLSA